MVHCAPSKTEDDELGAFLDPLADNRFGSALIFCSVRFKDGTPFAQCRVGSGMV